MKSIPYPSNPQAVEPLLWEIGDSEAKSAVENYGKEEWNKAKLLKVLSPIAEWAKTNDVSVICNEFGAIPWVAPRKSMLHSLKDVTQVFETYGIGWGHWYGLNMLDTELMQALGLQSLLTP
ncbi:hypothetical protein [Scytonema sp. PRP1]|uniref:hypothetical protein n=1 Tax=Scytonema sp. PRP1 TaxID=3120513 RepID=UPI002FD35DDB